MVALAAAAVGLVHINRAVNFTIPIYDDNAGSGPNQTFPPMLNYSNPATPYYGLSYHNFVLGGGFYGSTVCPGICTPHPYVWGQVDNHGQFGVGKSADALTTFDFHSFYFGCDALIEGLSSGAYNIPGNCTLNFKGYSSAASLHLPPVAKATFDFVTQDQPSPFTSLPIAYGQNFTLPATFKGLKYVTLTATIDKSTKDQATSANYTVSGARVMLIQSKYTINRPKV